MNSKNLFAAGIAAAAALAISTPASAADLLFDFGGAGVLNTSADPDIYTLTVGGVTVTASAFSGLSGLLNQVSFANSADVTRNSGGLGVRGNGSGEINDNGLLSLGEGILLTFNHEVTLTQALFSNFGSSDDVGFEWGSPLNAGETLDPLTVSGNAFNGSFTGTHFFFAANSLSSESFRLNGVTVNAPVPEPATWLMLILGFGMLGGVLRRKQRPQVQYDFA